MGTRADLYIGRGANAEWLGSIAYDGEPAGQPEAIARATSEAVFRAAVQALSSQDDFTSPALGWPWPWDTSHTTDYAYAWDAGCCWISCFGRQWYTVDSPLENDGPKLSDDAFPKMAPPSNPFHARSGVLLLGK